MIDNLDHETLVKVAKMGFMSRGLQLKDLVASVQGNPEEPQPHHEAAINPPFCVSGFCREMPTDKERLCCKEKNLCRSKSMLLETFVWILKIWLQ